jgi:hypothetical protein
MKNKILLLMKDGWHGSLSSPQTRPSCVVRAGLKLVLGALLVGMSAPLKGDMLYTSTTDPTGVAHCQVTLPDPTGGSTFSVGNLSLADLNSDPNQFTLNFEQASGYAPPAITSPNLPKPFSVSYGTDSEYGPKDPVSFSVDGHTYTNAEITEPYPGSIILTKGKSGVDQAISFYCLNANWASVIAIPSLASSGTQSLAIRNLGPFASAEHPASSAEGVPFFFMTFSNPVQRVGFVLNGLRQGDSFTIIVYKDTGTPDVVAAGSSRGDINYFPKGSILGADRTGTDAVVLDTYTLKDDLPAPIARAFFGYENKGGIRRVQIIFDEDGSGGFPNGGMRTIDDVSFAIVP